MRKIICIFAIAFILTGCGKENIVDNRTKIDTEDKNPCITQNEHEDEDDLETTTTNTVNSTNNNEYYNGVFTNLKVESIENIDGRIEYGILNKKFKYDVKDGCVNVRITPTVEYTIDEKITDTENIVNVFLYHDGVLHKFDAGDGDTYIYTKKIKNGEKLEFDISFKIEDENDLYRVIAIPRNSKYKMDDYGEFEPGGCKEIIFDFKVDLTENKKYFDSEDISFEETYIEEKIINDVTQTNVGKDIMKRYFNQVYNEKDEYLIQSDDGKYKYEAIRQNDQDEGIKKYSTFLVCDDDLIAAFDGKYILKQKLIGPVCISKDVNLTLEKGEHIIYSVTVEDNNEDEYFRSRFTNVKVEN